MGNKHSKKRTMTKSKPPKVIKVQETKNETLIIPQSVVPLHAKFQKIDIVAYGELFDKYLETNTNITNTVGDDIRLYLANLHNHYFDRDKAQRIKTRFGDKQFPIFDVLNFCLIHNQTELMEFLCTQELIETDLWCREYFYHSMRAVLKDAGVCTKLSTISVLASYMIPERITQDEVNGLYSSGSHWSYEQMCKDMVYEGMNGRAQRIIETRQALMNNIDIDFPKELIGVVISYAFGMFHNRKN